MMCSGYHSANLYRFSHRTFHVIKDHIPAGSYPALRVSWHTIEACADIAHSALSLCLCGATALHHCPVRLRLVALQVCGVIRIDPTSSGLALTLLPRGRSDLAKPISLGDKVTLIPPSASMRIFLSLLVASSDNFVILPTPGSRIRVEKIAVGDYWPRKCRKRELKETG